MHISAFTYIIKKNLEKQGWKIETYIENPDVINFVNEDGHVLGGFLIVYFDSGLQGGVLLSGENHINVLIEGDDIVQGLDHLNKVLSIIQKKGSSGRRN
ncbi:hypothetical protein OAK75_05125 [Bacteriovoracales bacterium]|nr:hypothetical protein [Bacteriovoracales bacterium]